MQLKKYSKQFKYLAQGSVVDIRNLSFSVDGQKKTLRHFYPEIKFDRYCLVLNQSCDLVPGRFKVSHILLACFEPLEKYFSISNLKTKGIEILDKKSGTKFTVSTREALYKTVYDELKKVVDNNERNHFFIELTVGNSKKLLVANLCKIFPVKIEHYDQLLKNSDFCLKPEFANKLAWKLAEFFGRIGTPDYDGPAKNRLIKKVMEASASEEMKSAILVPKAEFDKISSKKNKPEEQIEILKHYYQTQNQKDHP